MITLSIFPKASASPPPSITIPGASFQIKYVSLAVESMKALKEEETERNEEVKGFTKDLGKELFEKL
ncbi:hypothetical protein V6N11_013079 [Hibiscus sabdariffa]|uniref:Uncharacterized protein n=2 Tax=Hibiscus sabdariffa TaxID=183260 RepID=A0ABR2DIC6_9ROSI